MCRLTNGSVGQPPHPPNYNACKAAAAPVIGFVGALQRCTVAFWDLPYLNLSGNHTVRRCTSSFQNRNDTNKQPKSLPPSPKHPSPTATSATPSRAAPGLRN